MGARGEAGLDEGFGGQLEESQMRILRTVGQRGRRWRCEKGCLSEGMACAKVLGWEWPDMCYRAQATCKETVGLAMGWEHLKC